MSSFPRYVICLAPRCITRMQFIGLQLKRSARGWFFEIFSIMEMPDNCANYETCYGLTIINDLLALICYPHSMSSIYPTKDFLDIWIMNKYGARDSWIKKCTIRPFPVQIEYPLAIWKDHLLLLHTKSGFLVSYDLNSNMANVFNLYGHLECLRVVKYTESLTTIPVSEHWKQVQQLLSCKALTCWF